MIDLSLQEELNNAYQKCAIKFWYIKTHEWSTIIFKDTTTQNQKYQIKDYLASAYNYYSTFNVDMTELDIYHQ